MRSDAIQISLQQEAPIPLDIKLSCRAGEILVILGPSGSGKSTILRTIAGLYTPANGEISVNGVDWLNTSENIRLICQKRHTGMVFQQYALFPHLNALNNIILAMSHIETEQRMSRAEELLERVNMQGLGERYPHELSGGQQQRVAVARALARDPEVLLLDEPFSAVDQQTRRKLVKELVQLRSQFEIPIIHVTHDLNEARRIADRICVIHHGRSLQIDSPHQLITRPRNKNVAHLIGHYNIFSGTVIKHDEELNKTWIEWSGHNLETQLRPEFDLGTVVDWVIPAENLILHRRDRPSKGERENPVHGRISEFIAMGESTAVTMQVNGSKDFLSLSVPSHVAQRNNLENGADIGVSLLSEGIHLMAD